MVTSIIIDIEKEGNLSIIEKQVAYTLLGRMHTHDRDGPVTVEKMLQELKKDLEG